MSLARKQQTCNKPGKGGLSRAIMAHYTDIFSFFDCKVNTFQNRSGRIGKIYIFKFDH